MSTRCGIGLKTENGVKGIYCHYDGYIYGVGLVLEMFYKDIEKVKKLISLGNISSLGCNLYPPKVQFPNQEALKECHYASYSRSSFTVPYGGEREKAILYKNEKEFYNGIDGEYFYCFYPQDNKWYLLTNDKKVKKFELLKVMKNEKSYIEYEYEKKYSYYLDVYDGNKEVAEMEMKSAFQNWNDFQNSLKRMTEFYQWSEVKICNYWISKLCEGNPNFEKLEIGTSENKDLGKHYVAFESLRPGHSKRKVWAREKNLNCLLERICYRGYEISPYARPFFSQAKHN